LIVETLNLRSGKLAEMLTEVWIMRLRWVRKTSGSGCPDADGEGIEQMLVVAMLSTLSREMRTG
jgi:hypothetical protein